jgi:hypothetical protein
MSHDYLREIDLNAPPATGGPITNALDARAMHYFGFVAEGQEILPVMPFAAPTRTLVSWHFANQPTATLVPPPLIDAVIDFPGAPFPGLRYDSHHERAHVVVWLDPLFPPPAGQPCIVRIRAWSTK